MRHERFAAKSKPVSSEGRPYYKAAAHMPWYDKLPEPWRRLVDEYNSVNGVKHAMRKGLSPAQAREQFEAQRVKHQYDPIPDRAAEEKEAAWVIKRRTRERRMMNSLNAWLATREDGAR